MQHEFNYDDATLAKRDLKRLDIDPHNIAMNWTIDFAAQALRQIIIGIGEKMDGFMMRSSFAITVSSEVMAILAIARDVKDLRERMAKIIVAYSRNGTPVTAGDLEVAGAMTAIMHKAIYPNLVQTIEGNPVFVHAGPFANIAIGQSSIIADRVALKVADYHVTESGFGADIGYEKFWNLKCRQSGLKPSAAVIVCTVRALKMHGGGPVVVPGRPIPEEYVKCNQKLVANGMENLMAHIDIVKQSGVPAVVCINHFATDHEDEINEIRRAVEAVGARVAVSKHWLAGGDGAVELAEAVVDACEQPNKFEFLYPLDMPLTQRIETIATRIYGADGITFMPAAKAKIEALEKDPATRELETCMVKSHLSISHDPNLKGRPRGWTLPIRDVLIYRGAGFVVPVAGDIKLMPGTGSDPAFRHMDIDVVTGKVKGVS
jgi:formate--tetrahydrofolate ligase